VDFVAFIAMVIIGTAMVGRRFRKMEIIVIAAERFLRQKDFTPKEIRNIAPSRTTVSGPRT
jgi:hypothetical protein